MPLVRFLPSQSSADVDKQTKVLLAGRKAAIDIRFGCAACRCGMCAVRVCEGAQNLSPMKPDEEKLLKRLKLPLDGNIRLACQARVTGDITIDLDFQETYDPDQIGIEDED